MATTAKGRETLEREIGARLSDDQRRLSRKLLWQDRLTSLWAPVTVFGIAFLFYLVVVELRTANYLWAQPALDGFGLLMLAWFAALGGVRLGLQPYAKTRKLRHLAREQLAELQGILRRGGAKIDARARERLVEQAAAVDGALLSGDPAKLKAEIDRLVKQTESLEGAPKNSTVDFILGFAKAFAVAMLIRSVVLEPFKIPSGSMIPTLEIGDQIFVNKFIYGVRIPYANFVPFVLLREPRRGDVIVFNNPVDTDHDFIKRVIAIPGDRVKITDEIISINGAAQQRHRVTPDYTYFDQPNQKDWVQKTDDLFIEDLDGHLHPTLQHRLSSNGHFGEFVVPPKSVFVMGDNRDNSSDSRFGLGGGGGLTFVPYGNIKGKAMVIWLSLSHDGLLSGLFGGTGLRTDRLFLPVR